MFTPPKIPLAQVAAEHGVTVRRLKRLIYEHSIGVLRIGRSIVFDQRALDELEQVICLCPDPQDCASNRAATRPPAKTKATRSPAMSRGSAYAAALRALSAPSPPKRQRLLESQLLRDAWHGERRGARSLGEAILAYLDHAPRAEGDKRRLARILTALGDIRLAAIDQSTVDRCRRRLLAADASPATVRRGIITPLRAVMMHAAKRKWCDRPEFDIPRETEGRTRYLLPDQAERLIAAASPHIRTLAIVLLTTGMRMSEALELQWQERRSRRRPRDLVARSDEGEAHQLHVQLNPPYRRPRPGSASS